MSGPPGGQNPLADYVRGTKSAGGQNLLRQRQYTSQAVSGGLSRFEYDVGGQGDVMKLVVGPPLPPAERVAIQSKWMRRV